MTPIPTRACPYCGVEQPQSAAFCAACGHDFGVRAPARHTPPPAPAWDRRAMMQGRPAFRILLAFAAVLIASVPLTLLGDWGPGTMLWVSGFVVAAVGVCAFTDRAGLGASLRSPGGAYLPLAVPLAWVTSATGGLYLRLLEANGLAEPGGLELEAWSTAGLLFSFVFVPALTEEIAFRGIFLRTARIVLRPGWAQVVTAAIFAAIHLQPRLLPFHFALGLALGWLRTASGSLWPCMLLHAAHNALAVGLLPGWRPG